MKNKFNKAILSEELKRFNTLLEYSFYTEQPKDDDKLILGNLSEDGEETDDSLDFSADEAPADDSKTAEKNTGETPEDMPADDEIPADDEMPADDAAPEMPADDAEPEMPTEDEVDVDVTQLVQSGEEVKKSADDANQKTSQLLSKFDELEQKLASMSVLSKKIDTLEKEIVKRNPTPVEKLELRSLDSAPFNVKLKDFWKDVNGYDTGEETKKKEYVLTKDDVDSEYLDTSVKNSFSLPNDEDTNDYEEEEIY